MLDKSFNDQDAQIKGNWTLYSRWVDNSSCSPTVVLCSLHLDVRNMSVFWFTYGLQEKWKYVFAQHTVWQYGTNYFKSNFEHKIQHLSSFLYDDAMYSCIFITIYILEFHEIMDIAASFLLFTTHHGVPSLYDYRLLSPIFSTMFGVGWQQSLVVCCATSI